MVLLGVFWACTPLSDFPEIFTRGSIKIEKNSVLRIFEKFKFLGKQDIPKVFTVCPLLPFQEK